MVRSKYIDGKKVCSICKEAYPMTEEYFCRSNRIKDGFRGQCKNCKHKVDYEDVKAHVQKKNKERYEKNKDEISLKNKEYRLANAEWYKEYNKSYYILNSKEIKSKANAYYHSNKNEIAEKRKEYSRLWWKTDRGVQKRRLYKHKRKALSRLLPNAFTTQEWKEAIDYFGGTCAYCGESCGEFHQDHVIPLSKGGGYIKQNIIPACPACNLSKNAQDMEIWYLKQSFYSLDRVDKIHSWIGVDPKYNTQQLSIL